MRLAVEGLTAILSIITVGAALSLPVSPARAGDDGNSKNVTEDEIVRALAPPPKKPLTRGLSIGPQTDPAPSATETKLLQTVRGRSTRSLSSTERRGNRVGGQGQAEHRPRDHLRLQLGLRQHQSRSPRFRRSAAFFFFLR